MSSRLWKEKKVKVISEINDKAIKAAIDNPFASQAILANTLVMANIIKGESQFYDATIKTTVVYINVDGQEITFRSAGKESPMQRCDPRYDDARKYMGVDLAINEGDKTTINGEKA